MKCANCKHSKKHHSLAYGCDTCDCERYKSNSKYKARYLEAFEREMKKHAGDYGAEDYCVVEAAFRAGWNYAKREAKKE